MVRAPPTVPGIPAKNSRPPIPGPRRRPRDGAVQCGGAGDDLARAAIDGDVGEGLAGETDDKPRDPAVAHDDIGADTERR